LSRRISRWRKFVHRHEAHFAPVNIGKILRVKSIRYDQQPELARRLIPLLSVMPRKARFVGMAQ
jgi:hypothetical protein